MNLTKEQLIKFGALFTILENVGSNWHFASNIIESAQSINNEVNSLEKLSVIQTMFISAGKHKLPLLLEENIEIINTKEFFELCKEYTDKDYKEVTSEIKLDIEETVKTMGLYVESLRLPTERRKEQALSIVLCKFVSESGLTTELGNIMGRT